VKLDAFVPCPNLLKEMPNHIPVGKGAGVKCKGANPVASDKRIKLVKTLKEYKEAQGLSFYDAAQEDWVITYLCRANRGPISNEGLRDIYQLILQVVKKEAAALSEKERIEGARP
jgi:chorismate mutase